jgi:60 kDa SS-A/Ro ribonucleoprotein
MEPKHALAQLAATGCLNDVYYASASTQLDTLLATAAKVDAPFLARCAVYAREKGYMKDMPALLVAALFALKAEEFEATFTRVIDNGKMLRNFCQIVRSGVTGRKSFGTRGKRAIRNWLSERSPHAIFRASVGNDPSMADILKMVHPRPADAERSALYAYLIGKPYEAESLPPLVKDFEAWKRHTSTNPPDVPHLMLAGLDLDLRAWRAIGLKMRWQALRMNLQTLKRHGVLENAETVSVLADRLRDRESIQKARAFPYQLLMAFKQTHGAIPHALSEALQDALEVATENVPEIPGRIVVAVDSSGSMGSAVTGHRAGSTTAVTCADVAGLLAASIIRKNPGRVAVLAFDTRVWQPEVNTRDSVATIARSLARCGGGTNCSLPLAALNAAKANADFVIYVSDNESWADRGYSHYGGTGLAEEWATFKRANPEAKLALIDIQPYTTSQQKAGHKDTLLVGGFSDTVFQVLTDFAQRPAGASDDLWVRQIEAVDL